MAEQLRYLDEILTSYADNTQGLIVPINLRDGAISAARGMGFLDDNTPITLPITDGVPTIINPLLQAPTKVDQLWKFDGNNFVTQAYGDLTGLTVPPGYSKLLSMVGVLSIEKQAGGADNYSIQFVKNGVGAGLDEFVSFQAAGTQVVTVLFSTLADLSLNDTYGIQITGQGTSDDLILHDFEMRANDDLLLTAPGP